MDNTQRFYVDGAWVEPSSGKTLDVVDPASEERFATVALGSREDVDRAVAAAKGAFDSHSRTTRAEPLAPLTRVLEVYDEREAEMGALISREMGAPMALATGGQVSSGRNHLESAHDALRDFEFERDRGRTRVVYDPYSGTTPRLRDRTDRRSRRSAPATTHEENHEGDRPR